jgi:hypothetical protein
MLVVTTSLIPKLVEAGGNSFKLDQLRRVLEAPAMAKPIGTIESLDTMKINGRLAYGKALIWSGDLIQAPTKMSARVWLDDIGQIMLQSDTVVGLMTTANWSDDQTERRVLVASLTNGSLSVKLQPKAMAYLHAGGSSFTASSGASFRFGLREGQAVSEETSGTVAKIGNWAINSPASVALAATRARQGQTQTGQRRFIVRPINSTGAVYDVRARSTRQIQIQVTDENDRPVPDMPIIFALGGNIGRLSSTAATTNAQGVASVSFTANNQVGSGSVTATVQGTTFSWTGTITVLKAPAGFMSIQNAGPVFGVVAAVAAAAIITITNREDKKINPIGAPVIRP